MFFQKILLIKTTSLKQLFADNSSEGFKNFTISNVDLSHVTDCTRMFESCTNLETVTFDNTTPSGWSPIAPNMFYNCVGLKKVILPQGFSPTNIQSFLNRCSSLTEFPILPKPLKIYQHTARSSPLFMIFRMQLQYKVVLVILAEIMTRSLTATFQKMLKIYYCQC